MKSLIQVSPINYPDRALCFWLGFVPTGLWWRFWQLALQHFSMRYPVERTAFSLVIIVSWCATVGALQTCAQSETEHFESLKREGLESYRSGDLQKAERKLYEAGKIAKNLYGNQGPKYKDTLEKLALVYEAQGLHARASKVWKAIGRSSISDDTRFKRAEATNSDLMKKAEESINSEKYEEGLAALNVALKSLPHDPNIYYIRIRAFIGLHELDNALADANEAVKLDPHAARFHSMRGIVLEKMGEHQEAVEDYTEAIRIEPTAMMGYCNRSSAYLHWGKYEKGLADCNKVMTLAPEHARAFSNRGGCYAGLKQFDKALTDCNKSLFLNAKWADGFWYRAQAYDGLGKHQLAENDRKTAKQLGWQP